MAVVGRDRMVVGFITTYAITTNVVSLNPFHGELYSIQHYVIKFVGDMWKFCGFLWVLRFPVFSLGTPRFPVFPLPIKLTATI